MNKNVLVIAAHPDDELLGCGGTIIKHVENGDKVSAIVICEGETMRSQDSESKVSAMNLASEILGLSNMLCVGLPDQHLDVIPIVDVITPIENAINSFKPNIIYVHNGSDINKDHQIVFEATLVAARPKVSYIEEIYSYYTVGSSEWGYPRSFSPDTWIGFNENVLQKKIQAFCSYDSEICDYPNPRSPQALINLSRMMGNQCCMEYGEAFETIRRVIR